MSQSVDHRERSTGSVAWFARPSEEALEAFSTEPSSGLTADEASDRLDEHGPNSISEHKTPGALQRLASQFNQPLIYILLAAAGVTAFLQEWLDTIVIVAVVVVNAVVGFVQESRAVKALDALAESMTTEATVVRDGEEQRVDSSEVVPGDVVVVRSGEKVPADVRLLESSELRTDEAVLTGEAVPVDKDEQPVEEDTVLAERTSMIFASTVVASGEGRGVVVATSDETEVGKVSEMVAGVEELQTPLTRKISRFSKVLLLVIIVLGALTFGIGVVRGMEFADAFLAAVALVVASIPEGLPATMTIVLATGVNRMAARRAIIRKLPAVETLGSTTTISSDKTGTLTENQMTVTAVFTGGRTYEVTGAGYEPEGEVIDDSDGDGATDSPALMETLRCGLLCNDAQLVHHGDADADANDTDDDDTDDDGDDDDGDEAWAIQGDPTEGALVVAAHKVGMGSESEQEERPRLHEIPFESEHQYMATLHDTTGVEAVDSDRLCYLKGSVERVLERCGQAMGTDGNPEDLDRETVNDMAEEFASEGRRVLAFACKEFDGGTDEIDHSDVEDGFTFLGLQGMIDPPRPEAIEAVEACHGAGISVQMITGDHPTTASAIAEQLGIAGEGETGTVTGSELSDIDEEELEAVARETKVFARVSPEQKLRLVESLQQQGAVVAVTGDGVNDAPALKQADIGVAMGQKGSEAAKDASDMVLTDDNFASIRAAVEEGRGVFDNLVKFIGWTLPVNVGQALIVIVAVSLALDQLPVTPVQILWVNMSTAILLGLTLAFEPKEPGIMERPPRESSDPILSPQIITRILLVGGFLLAGAFGLFTYEREMGASIEQARTVAVNTYVVVQTAYLFNGRSLSKKISEIGWFSNPWIWVGAAVMLGSQLAITYVPVVQTVFGTDAIGLDSWLRILAVAAVTFTAVSVERRIRHAG